MLRLSALLAAVLLCSQTLVLAHDHDTSDDALCAVCTGSTVLAAPADPPSLAAPPALRFESAVPGRSAATPDRPSAHLARAPPAA